MARFTATTHRFGGQRACHRQITSPAPITTIVSPKGGATVHKIAPITVTGTTNATQTDYPKTMVLKLDGKTLGSHGCKGTSNQPRHCATTFNWNTTGLSGRHVLSAVLTTTRGRNAPAAAKPVYVYGGTRILLVAVPTQHAGHAFTVTGRVTALVNRSAVTGARVKLVVVPAVGKPRALYVRTDARGYFRMTLKPTMNTTVHATMLALPYYGTSHTYTKVKVIAHPVCSATGTIRRSTLDHGVCHVAGLLKGTKVTLQYQFNGHWYLLGSGGAPGPTVPFSFRFAKPGAYLVRLVFAATRAFVATTGPSIRVTVT